MPGWYKMYGKRAMDVLLSLALIVLLFLPFVFAAIILKATKRGLLVSQERYGTGKMIRVYKLHTIYNKEGADPKSNDKDDLETTLFSRFLRWFSIDEYPQFFLVLFGTMSMVGPRPFPPDLVPEQMRLEAYKVTPKGIFSPAARERRFRLPEAVDIEIDYCLRQPKLCSDLCIIAKGVGLVLLKTREGVQRQDEFILSRPRDTNHIPGSRKAD